MYKTSIKDKEFEFKTNLGTMKKIKTEFKKPITKLMESMEDFTIDHYIRCLKCGLKSNEEKETFKVYSEDLSLTELINMFKEYTENMFFGNMSKEEIEEKKLEAIKMKKEMNQLI